MKVLAAEFGVAVAMETWIAVKNKYMPWPTPYVRSAMSFSVLALLEIVAPGMGALLGAGLIIAVFVKNPKKWVANTNYPDSLGTGVAGIAVGNFIQFSGQGTKIHPSAGPASFIIGNGGTGGATTTNSSTGGTGSGTVFA